MARITHILFPFDFSSPGEQAARFVTALAVQFQATITLYSVMPPAFDAVPEGLGDRVGDNPEVWKRQLQGRLEAALPGRFAGAHVNRVADCGDPALRTIHFVESHGVDMIMMPTHGRGVFRRMLVGSTTAKILHDAKIPVWTAAHCDTQTAQPLPATVLCAVDGGGQTVSLLRWASDFCASCGARLQLLHVVAPVTDIGWLASERQRQEQFRQSESSRVETICRGASIVAPLQVVVGEVGPTVADVVRRTGVDLVIIGRGAIVEPFGRLRAQALGIIQRSPCPVLSV
jgi:nucleotide-binding universal stress UspA family protein